MTKFKPAGYNVLVKMVEIEKKSDGGIVLQTQDQEKREKEGQYIGEVVAFGPLVYCGIEGIDSRGAPEERAAMWGFKVGDIVQFSRYGGCKTFDNGEYRMIPDKSIEGIKQ